jgi:hypothetical protein
LYRSMVGLIASRSALVTGPMIASTRSRWINSNARSTAVFGSVFVSALRCSGPPEKSARVVRLVDRQTSALEALLTKGFETTREGLKDADLDGI